MQIEFKLQTAEQQLPYQNPNYKFGILKITGALPESAPETTEALHICILIDVSGSMSDTCSDGRTKLAHLKYTLQKMIEHLPLNTILSIIAFNDKINMLANNTKLTNESSMELLQTIDRLRAEGGTNIELALQTMYGTNSTRFIFLTDGEATMGETTCNELTKLVKSHTFFIGYGIEHDAKMLNCLASSKNSQYFFIDKLEQSGLVYGEILHHILYTVEKNVMVAGTNDVSFYNYRTNTWENTINIGDVIAEKEKVIHVRVGESATTDSVTVTVNNQQITNTNASENELKSYAYRQRTQELLFEANNATSRNKQEVKNKLEQFLRELKSVTSGIFQLLFKNMTEDISICLRTLGTNNQTAYTASRHHSQGMQTITAATLDDTQIEDSPNATAMAIQLMSTLSQRPQTPLRRTNAIQLPFPPQSFCMSSATTVSHNPFILPEPQELFPEMTGVTEGHGKSDRNERSEFLEIPELTRTNTDVL